MGVGPGAAPCALVEGTLSVPGPGHVHEQRPRSFDVRGRLRGGQEGREFALYGLRRSTPALGSLGPRSRHSVIVKLSEEGLQVLRSARVLLRRLSVDEETDA